MILFRKVTFVDISQTGNIFAEAELAFGEVLDNLKIPLWNVSFIEPLNLL